MPEKGLVFLIANLPYTLDISEEDAWSFVKRELERDLPWLLTYPFRVILSGVGKGWHGWRQKEHIVSHAGFRSIGRISLDSILAWITHFLDALKASRKGMVLGLAPTPEAGLGLAVVKLLRRSQVRLIVRVQGHSASKALFVHGSRFRFKVLEGIESFVLRNADLVLPMGRFTKELAIEKGVTPERIIVLPFPVRWANSTETAPLPLEPCVLFAGRLEKEKGVHVLLEAVSKVKKAVPSVRLLIAGDGSFRLSLKAMVEEQRLHDHVSFLGWLEPEELQEAYRKAWVLVLPSIWEEGLGMVLVEAGLMGRPVIGSDLGGIREIIQHGENGFLVPPGDPDALSQAIITLLNDRNRTEQMGLANLEVAWKYLSGRDEALERVRQAILALAEI